MGTATNMGRHDISGRIDAIGWGLLFLMTGVLVLVPGVPDGTWLVGLGLLMLGGNATRLYIGLPLDRFGVIIGAGALLAGLGALAGMEIPVFALGLIACGLAIIAGQLGRGGRTMISTKGALPHHQPCSPAGPRSARRRLGRPPAPPVRCHHRRRVRGTALERLGSGGRGDRRTGADPLRRRPRDRRHPRAPTAADRVSAAGAGWPPHRGRRLRARPPPDVRRRRDRRPRLGPRHGLADGPRGRRRPRRSSSTSSHAARRRGWPSSSPATQPTGGARAG